MAAGTAAALVPIKSITMRSRNDKFEFQGGSDEPGPACVKFLEQLQGIQAIFGGAGVAGTPPPGRGLGSTPIVRALIEWSRWLKLPL